MPFSEEAEEHVIACCLIDEGLTLDRAVSNQVSADSFLKPSNRILYSSLLELREARKSITLEVLAEELKGAGKLESAGGYAYLMQVSGRIPTTAHAGYFIEKVREKQLLREFIRGATGAIEQAYGFAGSVEDFFAEFSGRFKSLADGATPLSEKIKAKAISDYALPPDGDPSILLGNRYLNRGDGAVLSSSSGVGKSSMSIQMASEWALGRPSLGIPCNGPLRSLLVQSEDSEGDIAEIWYSIRHALKLSAVEQVTVAGRVKVVSDRVNRGTRFIAALRRHIEEHKPDLVFINPLQAFMDGDVTESRDLGAFLREGLNGINHSAFGYILIHHTTKPATGKDRAERLWHEVMYDMAGGAEIINWARAILSLRPAEAEGHFNLVLAKRGRRAGVTRPVESGVGIRLETVTTIPLKHATGTLDLPGRKIPLPLIFWESREPDPKGEVPEGSKSGRSVKYNFADFRSIFPGRDQPPKGLAMLHRAAESNCPVTKNNFYNLLKRWAEEGSLQVVETPGLPKSYRLAL